MKTTLYLGLVLISIVFMLTATTVSLWADDTGSGTSGTVTMPLHEFLNLNKKPVPPASQKPAYSLPVKFILTRGEYTVVADSRTTRVDGTLSLILYQSGLVEIPLIDTGTAINSAQLDGKDLPLYVKEDKYHFLAQGVGEHTLRISFYTANAANGNTRSASINLPQTTVTTMSCTVCAPRVQVNINPAIITTVSGNSEKTRVEATIPATDGAISLTWTPKQVLPDFVKKAPEAKPRLYGTVDTLLSIHQDTLKVTSVIHYSILYNTVKKFHFSVPREAVVTNITGTEFLKWEKTEKKGEQVITAWLSNGVKGNYDLTVTYERPMEKINSTWEIPVIELLGVERQSGTIGCYPEESIEATMAGLQGAYQIDEKELPAWTRDGAEKPILLAFKYQNPPCQISLETKKLEELPVLTTTIDSARAITMVNDEGTAITTITYTVRNNQRQYMELTLPEKSRMLSTFINNQPAKPIKGTGGAVMIPLLKSKGAGENEAFSVEITYLASFGTFGGIKVKSAVAPRCAVPISEFSWSLYLPKEERILKYAGNMKPGSEASVTIARKESTPAGAPRPAAPQVAISEKDCKRECAGESKLTIKMDKAQKEYETKAITRIDGVVSRETKGLNPIRMYIPEVGNIYRFHKLLVIDQSPTIIAYLYSNWIHSALLFSLCGFTLVLGLSMVSRGAHKAHVAIAVTYIAGLFILRSHIGEFFSYGLLTIMAVFAVWLWRNYSSQIIDAIKTSSRRKEAVAVR